MAGPELHLRQVRSSIGAKPKHRGALRALGLGRTGRTSVLPDRPEIRGMVARVSHLVEVTPEMSSKHEAPGKAAAAPKQARTAARARKAEK